MGLQKIVELEANPYGRAGRRKADDAMSNASLSRRLAEAEGRSVAVAPGDLAGTVPYWVSIGEEEQPFGGKAAAAMETLQGKLRTGEIDFATYYGMTSLFPALKILENWLDTYESHRDLTLGDKLYNILTNIQGQKEAYKRGFLPKWAFEGAKTLVERTANPYKRPGRLQAMYARSGELAAIAYSLPGNDTIGIPYEGMYNFTRLIKELNLYGKSELLIEYLVEHEMTHLKRRHPGSDSQDMASDELEVRIAVYNKYAEQAQGSTDERLRTLARIAAAFAYGHNGVGAMSAGASRNSIRKQIFGMLTGRSRPGANGDELYTGNKTADEPEMMQRPGIGSMHQDAQASYRTEIGRPLPPSKSEHVPLNSETHQPAQHQPSHESSTQYHAATTEPGTNQPGESSPQQNDYSATNSFSAQNDYSAQQPSAQAA